MAQLVFVPVTQEEAVALRAGNDLGVRAGCAATPTLTRAAGADAIEEEVEYAALTYAGELARSLGDGGSVLVLATELDTIQVVDQQTERGEVTAAELRWGQVQSLFADDPATAQTDDDPDLLWFGLEELDQL